MGWAVGHRNGRDIGYDVPSECDHPDCSAQIDRGVSYKCGCCELFFCESHLLYGQRVGTTQQLCDRCLNDDLPYAATPDTPDWIYHKLTDTSWAEWRDKNPDWVEEHKEAANTVDGTTIDPGDPADNVIVCSGVVE